MYNTSSYITELFGSTTPHTIAAEGSRQIRVAAKWVMIVFWLLLCSCEKHGTPNSVELPPGTTLPTSSILTKLNIADAKTIFITRLNSVGKKQSGTRVDSGYAGYTLFKITQEGYIVEVSYLDQKGDTIVSAVSPYNICNLSDNFLTVSFENYGTYLVRKSDGAVFKGNKLPISLPGSLGHRPDLVIQQDGSGNIYYVLNQEVVKLIVSDPNNVSVSTYSASGDQVSFGFVVDNAGNMLYNNRYRHASGRFENFNKCSGEWTDINNDFIYGRSDGPYYSVRRIIPSTPVGVEKYGDSTFLVNGISHLVKIKAKNKIVGQGAEFVFELYNQDGIVSKLPYSHFGVSTIKMMASSDNFYYIIGTNASLQSMVLKVDPNNHTYSSFSTSDYDIYNLVVSNTDVIQFYALRMSDGKRVLAQIDSNGNITVISVLDGSTVIALERIN
jgi:hypothetical protein